MKPAIVGSLARPDHSSQDNLAERLTSGLESIDRILTPPMRRDHFCDWSDRLQRNMCLVAYGHFGRPFIAFPSGLHTDFAEFEYERIGVIETLRDALESGGVKLYTVASIDHESRSAQSAERSRRQRLYDEYIRWQVVPFIQKDCQDSQVGIGAVGPATGGYHAVNTVLKHPDVVNRCLALSGSFDVSQHMGDDESNQDFYFNNPWAYLPRIDDPTLLRRLRQCHVRLATSSQEDSRRTYALNDLMAAQGVDSEVSDWGAAGGPNWRCWAQQMQSLLVEVASF